MSGMNKAIIIGNVGRDPEVRNLQNGGKVVSFSVATSESWKDKASGERKEVTEWHRVVIFNEKIGDIAERYVKKGSQVAIEGQIKSRTYTDKGGNEKAITEIVIGAYRGELVLLSDKQAGGGEGGAGGWDAKPAQSSRPNPYPAANKGKPMTDLDDDIPF